MLSIGTVDVHCDERFSQILRIAAWVRWYCWCCFSYGCLFQEDGFNFRFKPFQRQALCKRQPVLDLRIGHLSSNDMQGCLFQFVPGTLWTTLECPPGHVNFVFSKAPLTFSGLEILETKHQIHPFSVSQKLKPKNHGFMKFIEIHINSQDLIIFRIFPHDPFFEIPWLSPPGAPTVIGSPAGCPPDRYQWTRPWLWEHGLWPWFGPFWTPMDQEIHGKSMGIWITFDRWDMMKIWWGYNLIASKIIKDYGDYGFQSRCSLKN